MNSNDKRSGELDECAADRQATWSAPAADQVNLLSEWGDEQLASVLPWPSPDAHKYSRGTLALVAGSERYPGAAVLAARAALRMGAGYTQVFADDPVRALLLSAAPSLVVRPRADFDAGEFGGERGAGRRALCVGPGFDAADAKAMRLVTDILEETTCPLVVDGGGLFALGSEEGARALDKRHALGYATVVTPHAGEARRLAEGLGVGRCGKSPEEMAAALSTASGAIVVLKGPDTFVAAGSDVVPMREGTSALAKAGTGDVLAGMVGALLAQGVAPRSACVLATALHARAGRAAADAYTTICTTPEDVVEAIPMAVRTLISGR